MDIKKYGSGQHVNTCSSGEPEEHAVCSKDFDPDLLQIGSLSIVNSSCIQFGDNYYSGPVTINHVQPPTQTEAENNSESIERKQDEDIRTSNNESFDLDPNRTRIYERSVWTSRKPGPGMQTLKTPVPLVMISHSATPSCSDFEECAQRIRGFQEYHMDKRNWSDIGYNFLIGGDGRIYEGRGWDTVGAHTYGFNSNSTGICLIGNFDRIRPTPQQVASVHKLIELGVQLQKISPDYRVLGQRQVRATESPGKNLFALMMDWPHFGLQSSK